MEDKHLVLIFYDYIDDPYEIINKLDTDDKFIEWLHGGNIESLQGTLKMFEDLELYRHCSIIKDVLDQKKIIKEIDER